MAHQFHIEVPIDLEEVAKGLAVLPMKFAHDQVAAFLSGLRADEYAAACRFIAENPPDRIVKCDRCGRLRYSFVKTACDYCGHVTL